MLANPAETAWSGGAAAASWVWQAHLTDSRRFSLAESHLLEVVKMRKVEEQEGVGHSRDECC